MTDTNKSHPKNIVTAGNNLKDATRALIMIHGRGGNAGDIISLADHLEVNNFALLAPQANNNSWYPYSFMAPLSNNEPRLSAALSVLKEIMDDITAEGITEENIYFLGFSQGACLALEFVTRNAT
ncbi:MAG: phospholipase, partial [Ginsengibacter sp.]